MSFKGIAWAGNVYEKFEAMCLEVEEAMYQDTVKYMENQVQKVGVSVKKFYSEVMDDLRPISCVDPMSLGSDDSSLIPQGFTEVNKKPISSMLLKKENEDQAEKRSSLSGYDVNLFSPQSPGIFIENKSSEKCAATKKIGVNRRPIGIKRISRSHHPSKGSSQDNSVSEDRRSKVANSDRTSSRLVTDSTDSTSSSDLNGRCEPGAAVKRSAPILDNSIELPASDIALSSESVMEDTSRVACDDTNGISSSGRVMCESGAAVKRNTPSCDSLIEPPPSKNVPSAEPRRQAKAVADGISPAPDNSLVDDSVRLKGDPEPTSSCSGSPTEFTGASVSDIPSSVLGSSIRSKDCNLKYEKGVTMPDPDEGASMKDDSSSASSALGNTEFGNKDFNTSRDSFDMELVENDVPRLEKFETSEMAKLEESCILVEGDELHCARALQETRKHKSYKKRIREALSSKLKTRKGDDQQKKQEKQTLSVDDAVESDWELL